MPEERIITIGAMGRLTDQKGFDILLDALAILKNKNVNFRAKIGGDGEDKNKLLQQSTKLGLDGNLEFTGWVTDKKTFFESIDIFVLSSRYEPFGLVLLEAMKAHKPIVSTKCDGPVDILTNNKNAIITDITAPAIAAGLEMLVTNSQLQADLAKNAYELLLLNYTSSVVGKKINDAVLKTKAEFENSKHHI